MELYLHLILAHVREGGKNFSIQVAQAPAIRMAIGRCRPLKHPARLLPITKIHLPSLSIIFDL